MITAIYLGVGEDKVGTTTMAPDGIPDWHISLSELKSVPTYVSVTKPGTGCKWETPPLTAHWGVFVSTVLPNADIWFSQAPACAGGKYHVLVKYSDGTTDEADTTLPVPPATHNYNFNIVDQNGVIVGTGAVTMKVPI